MRVGRRITSCKTVDIMKPSKNVKNQVFIGHLTKDDIVYKDGHTRFNSIGGATLYCSGGAYLWGGNASIVSVIGTSYDYECLRSLAREKNLNIDGVHKIDGHGLDIWVLYDDNDDQYYITKYYSGGFDEIVPTYDMIPEGLLNDDLIFHITPMPLSAQADIVRYLSNHKCMVTLDPHQISCGNAYMKEWDDILPKLHIFFPSELQFRLLSGTTNPSANLKSIAKFADFYKVEILVLKAAEKGAYLYLKKSKALYHIPSAAKNIVDCTGAGDAFAGGYTYSYIHDLDPLKALYYASVSASFAMESYTAADLFSIDKQSAIQRLNGFEDKIEKVLY